MNILVTGGAGFIGAFVAKALIERGDTVVIVDNMNDYYDVSLKEARLKQLLKDKPFDFYKVDVADYEALKEVFEKHQFDCICHLAAQAGVRYSLENPFAYERANNVGMLNLLELARKKGVKNFIFASSSSVYGNKEKTPFSESDNVDKPVSYYAATKIHNERMAYTYHHLYGLNCTALRYFTVYGPYGRPDHAIFKFTKGIIEDKPIEVYNHGKMRRDFTFVADVVDGTLAAIDKAFPYEILNLGGDNPIELTYFIECVENAVGKKAEKVLLPMQPGDVYVTMADLTKSREKLGFDPKVRIEEGVKKFVEWYREFYGK